VTMRTITNALRRLRTPLLLAAGLASAGCMSFEDAAPIKIETHVQDWRDEIIYQVLVDRFANGDSGNDYRVDFSSLGHYHGGDWKGLEDRLDYIEGLGVTTIWISPVVKNVDTDAGFDGYHGYWAQDLDSPNPISATSPRSGTWWRRPTRRASRSSSTSSPTTWGRSSITTST